MNPDIDSGTEQEQRTPKGGVIGWLKWLIGHRILAASKLELV